VLGFFTFKYFNDWLGSHIGVVMFTSVFVVAKMIIDYVSFKNSAQNESVDVPYI
jgi:hypothetical protein